MLTHWKRLWCWEGMGAGGEGDDRGWDGWMASLTRWTWVWVNSRSWWWTGRPGALRFMGSQRVGHDWATELNWTELMGPALLFLHSCTKERDLWAEGWIVKISSNNCLCFFFFFQKISICFYCLWPFPKMLGSLNPHLTPSTSNAVIQLANCLLPSGLNIPFCKS